MKNYEDDKNIFNEDSKECLDKIIKRINNHTQKEEEIVSNSIYINWLESFTEKYSTFMSDDGFCSEEFTKDEYVNIDNLKYFFYGIDNYARKNYICPLQSNDYGYYYNIKSNFIDFNDVINSKINLDSEDVDKYLEDIADKVLELNKKGMLLKDIFENTYNKVITQTKKLTR